jgi:hypothetical protein
MRRKCTIRSLRTLFIYLDTKSSRGKELFPMGRSSLVGRARRFADLQMVAEDEGIAMMG